MTRLGAVGAAILMLGCFAPFSTTTASQTGGTRVPVVVELFTSEGCSDCPPADAALTRLAAQPIAGAEILALGEHVDYWDRQGWKDPFSAAAFSARQAEYARALRVESPYTPQMIVDGRDEFVGSDYAAAAGAVAKAVRDSARRMEVTLAVDQARGQTIPLQVRASTIDGTKLRGAADVFVAVTEDGLSSHVAAGENRGRDLHHTAVVRSLTRIGGISAGAATWSAEGQVALERDWRPDRLRLVAFVQDHAGRQVVGATGLDVGAAARALLHRP